MRVLVACEESQEVCKAFRARGHEAYSNDLIECSGGHPEWHLQMDCFEAIETLGPWDLLIGFPPCTYICNAGQSNKTIKNIWVEREQKTSLAIQFARGLYDSCVPKVAIENPVGVMSSRWRKPDQAIQPFYFGDPVRKYTCLWLKCLKPLTYIRHADMFYEKTVVEPNQHFGTMVRKGKYRTGSIRKLYWQDLVPKKDRAKIKSKTFPGIARAMAEQWG